MTKRSRLLVIVAVALAAATFVSRFTTADSSAEFMGSLNANVGPGSVISLSTPEGTLVSSVAPGTYDIHVTDQATNHNFHLEGAGVNAATSIDNVENADWTVDFADGNYTYRCDRHASLNGSFVSGSLQPLVAPAPAPAPVLTPVPVTVATAPAPAPTPAVTPAPTVATTSSTTKLSAELTRASVAGTLNVTLKGKDDLVVTAGGKPVAKVAAGTYRIVVTDRSAKHDVTIRKIGATPTLLTSRGYTGKSSIRVALTRGQWKLYSAANEAASSSFFKVSS